MASIVVDYLSTPCPVRRSAPAGKIEAVEKDWEARFERPRLVFPPVLAWLLGVLFFAGGVVCFSIGLDDSSGRGSYSDRGILDVIRGFLISFGPLLVLAVYVYLNRAGRRRR